MRVNYIMAAFLLFLLCILVLLFSRCLEITDAPENQLPELAEQYEEIRRDYKFLQEEYRYLERLAKVAVDIILAEDIDQEQLVKLAQTQWEYSINLYESNENILMLETKLALETLETVEVGRNFVVSFGESWSPIGLQASDILPSHIMQLGAISDVYVNHLQIISPVPYETIVTDGGTVHGVQYRFKDVPARTEIKLVLTPELQARLGHPSGTIIIKVRELVAYEPQAR